MRGVLFIARVSLICNFFFVICLLMRHTFISIPKNLDEFVIITGWTLSVIINFIFAICTIVFLTKRQTGIPFWLIIINNVFFLFQIFYFLIFTFQWLII